VPYPFAEAPTTAVLIERLKSFGATVETTQPVPSPRGPVSFRYLRRTATDGLKLSESLPEDEEFVGWDKLRRICRQLDVDPKKLDIGLHLG
jgi:hypothetical protein